MYRNSCDNVKGFNYSNKTGQIGRVLPKRVCQSKKICQTTVNGKSCSTGIIAEESHNNKTKKSTKSESNFPKSKKKNTIDFCNKCGDHTHSSNGTNSTVEKEVSTKSTASAKYTNVEGNKVNISKPKSKTRSDKLNPSKTNGVKQYYRNENFQSTDSIQDTDIRKTSLDTIKELSETHNPSASGINIYDVYTDSDEEIGFLDTNDSENIENLKKFREKNYFECHSVKSRIDNKGSVISLKDHKCVYRFYLNDRLFPVPISSDHNGNARCIECHLPIHLKMEEDDIVNGTIQAKVKLNDEARDMVLLLPVKDTLVMKEKRRQIKEDSEVMYFGVVKLDSFGNSVFKSTRPTDSYALKYQKGYHEVKDCSSFNYKGVKREDVLII